MSRRILIVDDHYLLSQALGSLIDSFEGYKTVGICKNGREAVEKIREDNFSADVILMDVKMPIINGIEATQQIVKFNPSQKVLALSIEEDERLIIQMIRAGARGYLLKDVRKEVLRQALHQVYFTGYYSNEQSESIKDSEVSLKPEELSQRERSFIKYACSERTYKEIAEKMCVSPKTIEGYRDSVYKKLNTKNRIGLVLHAIRNGIFIP